MTLAHLAADNERNPRENLRELLERASAAHTELIRVANQFDDVLHDAKRMLPADDAIIGVVKTCKVCQSPYVEHRDPDAPSYGFDSTECYLKAQRSED